MSIDEPRRLTLVRVSGDRWLVAEYEPKVERSEWLVVWGVDALAEVSGPQVFSLKSRALKAASTLHPEATGGEVVIRTVPA